MKSHSYERFYEEHHTNLFNRYKEAESNLKENGKKLLEDLKNQIDIYSFEDLYNHFVPEQGTADTTAGELLRAMNFLLRRGWNGGDIFYRNDIGAPTLPGSAVFIGMVDDSLMKDFIGIVEEEMEDVAYLNELEAIKDKLVKWLVDENQDLFVEDNDIDSRNLEDLYEIGYYDDYFNEYRTGIVSLEFDIPESISGDEYEDEIYSVIYYALQDIGVRYIDDCITKTRHGYTVEVYPEYAEDLESSIAEAIDDIAAEAEEDY